MKLYYTRSHGQADETEYIISRRAAGNDLYNTSHISTTLLKEVGNINTRSQRRAGCFFAKGKVMSDVSVKLNVLN